MTTDTEKFIEGWTKKHWKEERNEKGELIITKDTEAEAREILYKCYEQIIAFNNYYMDLPEDDLKLISIWIIGTYFHEQFNTYPYLFLNAMRGSGKTRQLKIISHLGNKGDGVVQNDLKEAVLFRMKRNKILCVDEFESIGSKDKQTLRQLFNAAYKKGMQITRMKKVYKNKEEKYEEERFEPYMPICMANIWGMEEVLEDRSITIQIEKSNNLSIIQKIEDFDDNYILKEITTLLLHGVVQLVYKMSEKNIIYKWNNYLNLKYNYTDTLTTITTLNNTNNTKIELSEEEINLFNKISDAGISGRNFELAFPLILTAQLINEEVFEDILRILKDVMKEKKEGEFAESRDVSFYNFVSGKDSWRFELIPIKQITTEFRVYMGEQDYDDKWLNEKWIGRALKRLKLKVDSRRMAKGMEVMIDIDKAKKKILMFQPKKKTENEKSK